MSTRSTRSHRWWGVGAALALLGLAAATRANVSGTASQAQRPPRPLASPDGKVTLAIGLGAGGQLTWSAALEGTPVIEPSPLGIVVDGVNHGAGAEIFRSMPYQVNEQYDWLGGDTRARGRSSGARVSLRHSASGRAFNVEARAADSYVAFRISVPGSARQVPDAAVAFTIPRGATIWSHGLRNHYEDQYDQRPIEDMPAGDWAGPPVTFRLKNRAVYAAITEADLRHYPGMALQAA